MEAPPKITDVTFRFGGPEDVAEILALVNHAFSVEKGDTALAFTSRDRVNKEEVDACLHGSGGEKRWLVLETLHPEEKMVAACLICTDVALGKGSVEVLAVDPTQQGEGLGSHMLRRAEGILLNFRCRFVRMRVPQWREDVLEWAVKRGYKETGGGVWGELDGESAEDLTRPTRYLLLTRDLLADEKVMSTFGDGTARFTAASAAAAAGRAAVANDHPKPARIPASTEGTWGPQESAVNGRKVEDDSGRLAGFLSSVLKGLADAEGKGQEDNGAKGIAAAPMADMAVGTAATSSCPCPQPVSSNTGASDGAACQVRFVNITSPRSTATVAPGGSSAPASSEDLEVSDLPISAGEGIAKAVDGEESLEGLLRSLMRTLNTEQGRADFRLLAATGPTS